MAFAFAGSPLPGGAAVSPFVCGELGICNPKSHDVQARQRYNRRYKHVITSVAEPPIQPAKPQTQTKLPQDVRLGFMTPQQFPELVHLEVIGKLPSYLKTGTYYRNGPGLFEVEHKDGYKYTPEHWFDVLSMVHAFFINTEDGTVQYRNKVTADEFVRTIQSVKRDDYVSVAFSKRKGRPETFLEKLRAVFQRMTTDPESGLLPMNAVVALAKVPGKGNLNAATDANIFHRLHPSSLRTVEKYDVSTLNPDLKGFYMCSHGMFDEDTGEYFNYVVDPSVGKVDYKVYRINPSGKAEVMTTIKDYWYYVHSFSLTENYVIMILWPNQVDLLKLLSLKSFADACSMRPNTNTKFVVISRKTNEVVSVYEHEPFFCFHTINAFEKDDDIMIDLSWYENIDIIHDLRLDNIVAENKIADSRPRRFTLSGISDAIAAGPQKVQKATSVELAPYRFEFARIAPSMKRKQYKYAYGTCDGDGERFLGGVMKIDVQTGAALRWTVPGLYAGEPIFVPDPNGSNEDDGCLLVMTLNVIEQKSALVVLDARTLTEIARAVLPTWMPVGFHGFFKE